MKRSSFGAGIYVMALWIFAIALFSLGGSVAAAPDAPWPTSGLFQEVAAPMDYAPPDEPNFIRSRLVTIDFDHLGAPADGAGINERLILNLFADASFIAVRDRVERNRSGSYTWIGHFEGFPDSQIILVVRDDMVVGTISVGNETYDITSLDNDLHVIRQVDQSFVLPASSMIQDYLVPNLLDARASVSPAEMSAADDGSIIDIIVIYTDDAADSTIVSEIELAVAATNQAYINSDIDQRLWLTHMEEVTYIEGPIPSWGNRLRSDPNDSNDHSGDLEKITIADDGIIDNAHTLRNTYHADLTMFLVEDADGNANVCRGLAWLQDSVTPSFQANGFAAMESCLSWGNVIFSHEFGHNMGARHDWYMDNNSTPYSYAHGHVFPPSPGYTYHTIMAYGDECADNGGSCSRIPYFSNPDVTYGGVATGVSSSGPSNCSTGAVPGARCQADVHLTLNNTAANTSGFRTSEVVWTGASSNDWSAGANWDIAEGVPGLSTTVHRAPRTFDDVRIPAATSNIPTISIGSANARNVLIEAGATLNMTGGTLNVYGQWEEQGAGVFNATGGDVAFVGAFDQGISSTANSTFYNVTFGDGISTQRVTAGSDLDINGNITFASGVTFSSGSHTIEVAGNWNDLGGGFLPETSTVVFDGGTQTADKVTTQTLLDEDFNGLYTGCCGSVLPVGWDDAEGNFYQGQLLGAGIETSNRWRNQTDGYLFTKEVSLKTGVAYQFDYKVAARQNYSDGDGSLSAQSISIVLATGQTASDIVQILSVPTLESSTTLQSRTVNFTVGTSRTYRIGLRAQQSGDDYAAFDDIMLNSTQDLTFYDLQISNTGSAAISDDLVIDNNLTVNNDGVLDLSTKGLTVEGTLINNGTLKQTKDTPNSVTTEFLRIKNAAGTADKYYGVEITPSSGSMGQSTVAVSGKQFCTGHSNTIQRCYEITPAPAQSATSRFYYRSSELNGQSSPKLWHWNGSSWDDLGVSASGGSGDGMWIEATTSSYSPFTAGDDMPAVPTAAPAAPLAAMTKNGANIELRWEHADVGTSVYQIWRISNQPYFEPPGAGQMIGEYSFSTAYNVGEVFTFRDNGVCGYFTTPFSVLDCTSQSPTETVLGDVANNYTWVVRVSNGSSQFDISNRIGQFDYAITPGS